MTNTISPFGFTSSRNPAKTIGWSGLVAGILDSVAGVIVYYIYFDLNPLQVLQFIASGIYGPTAINGGVGMVLVGLLLHFLIAYVCAIIYFLAYPKIAAGNKYAGASGLVYGLGIWLVMNLLILPYSNIPKSDFDLGLAIIGIIWHMVLVGWPIALITKQYYLNKTTDHEREG
ncbi:MAG: DUF1440 domain-containing protein [Roseivirga sp.]|nr:DUF1440 domain-containing protein [Roseivirga sp.]